MTGTLDLEVTRRCNLRCSYCFVGWSRDWHTDMPEPVAHQIIEEGEGLFSTLHITGGEPFAYRALFDLLDAGARRYPAILINTNGTMLPPDGVARIASYGPLLSLSVSLDGPEPIHDLARGPGRFEQASSTVSALLEAGVAVTVMTVVTPEVLRGLAPFLRDLRARHPRLAGVTLFPVGVGPEGSQAPGTSLRPLSPAEVRELVLTVALVERTGFAVGIGAYPIVNPMLRALGYPESRLYHCEAGRGRLCVHADLSVSSCHPVKEAIYGRYQTGMFRRLDEAAAHARLAARDFDGCRSCEHREGCGNCRAFVTARGEDLFGNDEICHNLLPGRPREGTRRVSLPIAAARGPHLR